MKATSFLSALALALLIAAPAHARGLSGSLGSTTGTSTAGVSFTASGGSTSASPFATSTPTSASAGGTFTASNSGGGSSSLTVVAFAAVGGSSTSGGGTTSAPGGTGSFSLCAALRVRLAAFGINASCPG